MKFEVLENHRAQLIPILSLAHTEALRPLAIEQAQLSRYSPSSWHSNAEFDAYFTEAMAQRLPFLVYDKLHKCHAGSSSFGNYSAKDARVEIGWTWISQALQRSGLNSSIKYLMLSHAFEQNHIERVEFKADARNTISTAALSRLGATYEGRLRSHTMMNDGHRRDTVYYSILKHEWPPIASNLLKDINR